MSVRRRNVAKGASMDLVKGIDVVHLVQSLSANDDTSLIADTSVLSTTTAITRDTQGAPTSRAVAAARE